jgi:hypothetical protein
VARVDRVVVAVPWSEATTVMHATRVCFGEGVLEHEVTMGCCCFSTRGGAGEKGKEKLWVNVDDKRAVHACHD